MTPVGLYSISVRGLTVPEMLRWARHHGVPFLHLRGGPRGFDLARRSPSVLRKWARASAAAGVPVSGVTADLDLADLLRGPRPARRAAAVEFARLAEAAALLGAGWVRLLAGTAPAGRYLTALADEAVPQVAVRVLAEPHHPHWLTAPAREALGTLLDRAPHLRLLADTAQLASALPHSGPAPAEALKWVMDRADVLHLSDHGTGPNGTGLDGAGPRRVAAAAATRIAAGLPLEVAVEWTGPDRTPAACMARYRAAAAWWREALRTAHQPP